MKALAIAPLVIAVVSVTSMLHAQDTTNTGLDTTYATYKESPISLPLGFGLRIPSYDRVNGLALPWGPKLELGDGRLDVDGLVTYRSNLGKWDPSLEGSIRPGDENELRFFAGRGTFTNDAWIRGDLTNSAAAFFAGSDSRNYYRADRGTARFARTFTSNSVTFAPFVGGAALQVVRGDLEGKLDANLEQSVRTALKPDCAGVPAFGLCSQPLPGDSFTQATFDGRVSFPTFGTQTFAFKGHAVMTGGSGITPVQRFAYLGGSSTLATVNLLALGGDRLLFVQGDYIIPIDQIQLPFVGSPYVGLRYAAGNAGVGGLPALIQNLGVGLGASFFRADYSIDPAQNRSPFSRKSAFSLGVSLSL